jgi:hypothetical protein
MSSGHLRLDTFCSTGKRQMQIQGCNGGAGRTVVSVCKVAAGIDDAINDANHFTWDGSGYFGHSGWDAGGHETIGALDVLDVLLDADLGKLYFKKNGVLVTSDKWVDGDVLGNFSVMFGSSTNIASATVEIVTDPALFMYPESGYTGFGSGASSSGGRFFHTF